RDRMLLVEEEVAPRMERRGDATKPLLHVRDDGERAETRVDEVEPATAELTRELGRVGLHPQDGRPPLARGLERLAEGVDAGDDAAELGKLRRCLAAPAVEMQHPLVRQVCERVPHR